MASHETNRQLMSAKDRDFLKSHGDMLSDSTKRAHWIDSVKEHEGHPGETLATREHDVIQHWAEDRDATPATVPGTEHGNRAGVLRFEFGRRDGGDDDSRLQTIAWDEWFKTFDRRDLVFLFQEHKANGDQSNFFHFDNPNRERG